jgi:hypothetical protein
VNYGPLDQSTDLATGGVGSFHPPPVSSSGYFGLAAGVDLFRLCAFLEHLVAQIQPRSTQVKERLRILSPDKQKSDRSFVERKER